MDIDDSREIRITSGQIIGILSYVGFAQRTPTERTIANKVCTIYTIMLSHDPQATIKRSIVRYIYIQAYIASIYIYMGMYTYAGIRNIQLHPKLHCKTRQNKVDIDTQFFLAKGGECHEFPLPIGQREWLKKNL